MVGRVYLSAAAWRCMRSDGPAPERSEASALAVPICCGNGGGITRRASGRRLWSRRLSLNRYATNLLRNLIQIDGEADGTALGFRRVRELTDGREDGGDRGRVFFQLPQARAAPQEMTLAHGERKRPIWTPP